VLDSRLRRRRRRRQQHGAVVVQVKLGQLGCGAAGLPPGPLSGRSSWSPPPCSSTSASPRRRRVAQVPWVLPVTHKNCFAMTPVLMETNPARLQFSWSGPGWIGYGSVPGFSKPINRASC
jgi:hypothetical protein